MKEIFEWRLHPIGSEVLNGMVNRFCSEMPDTAAFRNDLIERTGTRLFDWIDHMLVPWGWIDEALMKDAGFMKHEVTIGDMDLTLFDNENSCLFPLFAGVKEEGRLYLKVESIEEFARINGGAERIQGKRWSPRRKMILSMAGTLSFGAIERRGYQGYQLPDHGDASQYLEVLGRLNQRDREINEDDAFNILAEIIEEGVNSIGMDRTADAFFHSERRYWRSRNAAGRAQLARQDELGLGWGNHDHHTFRCSRENMGRTVEVLERMGMRPREKFYAGEQAGWGAQVMEHEACGITVFADVDMTPDEKEGDFIHMWLDETEQLGTVGLWVGLHGDSILSAGLHHLAVKVSFSDHMNKVRKFGMSPMKPFSNFPYLKQSFTQGERWKPVEGRVRNLLEKKLINRDQMRSFMKQGAAGSHLELIERNHGFKGFNQEAVSDIIKRTDPRA
ncbi:MAG: hypothetical protein ACMUHU_03070 [Thermoplasmatota archaeon]